MGLTFIQLNDGWNADPNDPQAAVRMDGSDLVLTVFLNAFQYDDVSEGDVGRLRFVRPSRWRLGPTNDHGWFQGQCRYSALAPAWGELFEISGDDPNRDAPDDWEDVDLEAPGSRHFLFYLRDETFECRAEHWSFSRL